VNAAILAVALCTALSAAQPSCAADAAPAVLSAHVHDGKFSPGDFGWLRWRFSTNVAERAKWTRIMDWVHARQAEHTAEARRNLAALGVVPKNLETNCYGDETCWWLSDADALANTLGSWNAFAAGWREARPYFLAYDLAARNAEDVVSADPDAPLAARLNSLRIGDQIFLKASDTDPTKPPLPLSLSAARVFRLLCWHGALQRILADTAMLKAAVAKQGWPTKSAVGADAADTAWLIAQHSDSDPAFQLTVLRLMKPLADRGEARADRYAYLYDRVMLRLKGKERYATQFQCVRGHMEPDALEDAAKVDVYRRQVGLKPLAEYEKHFPAHCEDAGAR
jgi:hypothetical protein